MPTCWSMLKVKINIAFSSNNHRRKELWVQALDLCKNTVKFLKFKRPELIKDFQYQENWLCKTMLLCVGYQTFKLMSCMLKNFIHMQCPLLPVWPHIFISPLLIRGDIFHSIFSLEESSFFSWQDRFSLPLKNLFSEPASWRGKHSLLKQ